MDSAAAMHLVSFHSPMTTLEATQASPAADPSPSDPNLIFIHPPFEIFPDSHLHPGGLTWTLMAANPEWFLDPRDFVAIVGSRPNATQYPVKFEPPRKKTTKTLAIEPPPTTESDDARYRCPFCRKGYAGENGKSMWRRHVTKRHNIALSSRREVKRRRPRDPNAASTSAAREDGDSSDASGGERGSFANGSESRELSQSPDGSISKGSRIRRFITSTGESMSAGGRSTIMTPPAKSSNRVIQRTPTDFVGVAIRQMAEQAYNNTFGQGMDLDGNTAPEMSLDAMLHQPESSTFRLRRASWSTAAPS